MAEKPSVRKKRQKITRSVRFTEEEMKVYDEVAASKGLTTNAYFCLVMRETVFNRRKELLKKDD